jgi:NhaA family Na+:H+ antiporter
VVAKQNNLIEFFKQQASAIVLFAFTIAALVWANSSFQESYHSLWNLSFAKMSLHHWINDGLMTVFFVLVGIEIKREIVQGELSSRAKASLPVAAALGGMVVPAFIYTFFNFGTAGASGWGIPMATDIAFAIGVMSLFGNRVTPALKMFLMALAVADDIGAVIVIAIFYTADISLVSLGIGVGILAALFVLNRMRVLKIWIYLGLGAIAWFAFLKSGVHATIAGVLLAFVIPLQSGLRLAERLHSLVSFGIMPLFALANAGVSLSGAGTLFHPVSLGIVGGLFVGKQVGITVFSWIAVRLGLASLPEKMGWGQIYAVGCLGGIGFTMSLFVANLAFTDAQLIETAKLGILVASLVAALFGSAVLYKFTPSSQNR